MENLHNDIETNIPAEILLPWHRPAIQQLVVTLDTNQEIKKGSLADGTDRTRSGLEPPP